MDDKTNPRPCYFVCSNRVGVELGIKYMGSSCILQLRPDVGIIANLNKKEQNYIMDVLYVWIILIN